MASVEHEESLEAVADDIVFRSEDGRFAVIRMLATERSPREAPFTAVGDLGSVAVGETLRLLGRWTTHATYGERFRVSSYTPTMPETAQGIARYLGSGLISGIGPALAARLVERFGTDTLDVIATQSGRLREVPGIGRQRARAIAEAIRHRRDEAETMSFLHSLGLGPRTARAIVRKYGTDASRVVQENPYLVGEQIRGIGFRTADRIARACGIDDDDPRRVQGAALHVIAAATDEGHVFSQRETIGAGVTELGVPAQELDDAILALEQADLVIAEEDRVYPRPLFVAEKAVAGSLAALANRAAPTLDVGTALRAVDETRLSGDQKRAVEASLRTRLMVLTGGPGTGKTTTVRAIVDAHTALSRRIILCAPTGRAAKRLSEASGSEAKTIHRTLEWNPMTGRFNRNRQLPLDADLILVDEASMVDLRLAHQLLDAVPTGSTLVLVGDVDQLPPVGPGQPLRDLIESRVCTTVRLTEVFRQAQQSAIIRGAHAVLEGRAPESTPTGTRGEGDLFMVANNDPEVIVERLVQTLRRIKAAYAIDPKRDVQVMTPMRRGPLGTHRLNEVLQAALNPLPDDAPASPGLFRPGDKVMQLFNDYDKEVFNGDLGEVRRLEGGITYVQFDGREVQYNADELDALTLAYACTVHKVQGSEFPAAVMILHTSHFVLLSRPLLYTGLTRAKKLAVLLGDPRAVSMAARNAVSYETNSRLQERLIESSNASATAS